jgi:T1SS-143 domain-containing protein
LTGWTDLTDLEAAVEALSVSVTAGFDGTITGTLSMTTAEANTPQSNAPLSGAEPDTTDNTVTNNVPFSLAVDSVPTAGNTNIAVDEDDLPSGNHDVALGDDLPNGSPTSITGNLNFSYEADSVGGTIDFAALNGTAVQDTLANPVSSAGTALTYYWDAGSKTLYASKDTTNLSTAQGTAVFLVVVTNMATGAYQFDLLAPVDHPTAGTEDNITISIGFTVTDGDGDVANGTLTVNIDDDSPAVLAKTDLIFANSSNPTPGGTGVFDYSIGADERTDYISGSDFSTIVLSGMVGSVNISTPIVIQTSEDANSAVFAVSFSYAANPLAPGVLTAATGTLTFDKVSGTYTMALDQQIESFTVLTTSNTISKESFDLVVQGVSQPEVVVSKLADGFFARFSADHAVQGGSPVPLHAGALNSDLSFVAGDLFSAAQTWVSISGSQNGVASDTLQKGEVLDMQFYTSSPGGSATPGQGDALASGMFLKLAKLNAGEDMVIILRLIDPDTSAITTRAIVVDYGDIWLSSQINPYGITFADGSDGVIIIESNDYNINVGDNWLIYGAQLLVSTESVTSATDAAIDLNRNTGDTGGSTFGETLGGDTVDNDVIKVVDIGIITATTSTQDTHLSFGFQVIDGDGDATSIQTLNVVIEGSTTFVGTAAAESIQGSSGVDTISDGAGADIIRGGNGADIINLTADGTSDVLVYNLLSEAGDVVTNFNTAAPGAGGDVLDISDLLDLGTFAGTTTAQAIAGQYLQVIDSGGNALVQVDLDGAAGGNSWTTMVTLNSVIATNVLDDNIVVD